MNTKSQAFSFIYLLFFLLLYPFSFAHSKAMIYQVASPESNIVIRGDSTLHEWQMTAENIVGIGNFALPIDSPKGFQSFELKVLSKKIQSEHSSMDEKAHDALNSKKHPNIIFTLESVNFIGKKKGSGLLQEIDIEGSLFIAGKTRKISTLATLKHQDKSFIIQGSHQLKMTDYGISPPKAFFIKTENKIFVDYKLVLYPKGH